MDVKKINYEKLGFVRQELSCLQTPEFEKCDNYTKNFLKDCMDEYSREYIIRAVLSGVGGDESDTVYKVRVERFFKTGNTKIEVKEYDRFYKEDTLKGTYYFDGYIKNITELRQVLKCMGELLFLVI